MDIACQKSEDLDSARVGDDDLRLGGTVPGAVALDFRDDGQAFNDFAENDMGSVQPAGRNCGDEELRSIGVLAGVSHGELTRPGVLHLEVLICEFFAVDALSTSAVSSGKVATLKHELGDDTMECAALVAEAWRANSELTEVLGGFGDNVIVEFEDDPSSVLAVDGDVKVDVGHLW